MDYTPNEYETLTNAPFPPTEAETSFECLAEQVRQRRGADGVRRISMASDVYAVFKHYAKHAKSDNDPVLLGIRVRCSSMLQPGTWIDDDHPVFDAPKWMDLRW